MPITTTEIIAVLSFLAMLASFIWTLKNIKRSSKEEIQAQATEKANMANSMARTSENIVEIKDKVEGIDAKLGVMSEKQNALEKEFAVAQRDIKTAFKKIDEIKAH